MKKISRGILLVAIACNLLGCTSGGRSTLPSYQDGSSEANTTLAYIEENDLSHIEVCEWGTPMMDKDGMETTIDGIHVYHNINDTGIKDITFYNVLDFPQSQIFSVYTPTDLISEDGTVRSDAVFLVIDVTFHNVSSEGIKDDEEVLKLGVIDSRLLIPVEDEEIRERTNADYESRDSYLPSYFSASLGGDTKFLYYNLAIGESMKAQVGFFLPEDLEGLLGANVATGTSERYYFLLQDR